MKDFSLAGLFNHGITMALQDCVEGYVSRLRTVQSRIEAAQKQYNLKEIFRMDLGQNSYGPAPQLLRDNPLGAGQAGRSHLSLSQYPHYPLQDLKASIAHLHDIDKKWIVASAGIEQMIDIIAATFLDSGDRVVIPAPSFFVFENFSRRRGGTPCFMPLKAQAQYNWDQTAVDTYSEMVTGLTPKLSWIANPNNPTGQAMPMKLLQAVLDQAYASRHIIVIDEAYGEYMDPLFGVSSASKFLSRYPNLIVLRTFSKAYGLASIRVGYAMTANPEIKRALLLNSNNYPISELSLQTAHKALHHLDYLETTRRQLAHDRSWLHSELNSLTDIEYIPSTCNIMMLRHKRLNGPDFLSFLESKGLFAAGIFGSHDVAQDYIRITIGDKKAAEHLIASLRELSLPSSQVFDL